MSFKESSRTGSSGPSDTRDDSESRFGRLCALLAPFERDLWFLVAAAMLVDVTLTVHGLVLGLPEQNPVARFAIDTAGVLGLYALKLVALLLGGSCRSLIPDRYSAAVPLGLAVPSVLAVGINTVVIAWVTF